MEEIKLSPDTIMRFDVYDGWFSFVDAETETEAILPLRDTSKVITGIALIRQRLIERDIQPDSLRFDPSYLWEKKYTTRPLKGGESRKDKIVSMLANEAVQASKIMDRLCYLHADWSVNDIYEKGWLFRAYPGGRCEWSRSGAELAGLIDTQPPDSETP